MLQTKVFISSDQHDGFGVSSTIVYGPTEALLVDAQFTRSNAHRLVAEILEIDKPLKQVFISHMHPDHYLGLEVVVAAFPGVRVMAFKAAADEINEAYTFKIHHWGAITGSNGPTRAVPVERLDSPHLLVDGEPLEIIGLTRGDAKDSTGVWIPSTKTLIATDLVFSDAHVWVADARTPADRQAWFETLNQLEELAPALVIPGHAPHDRPYSPDGIGFTRRYLTDFIHHLENSADSTGLIAAMERLYPEAAVHICLDLSAKILRDKYNWDGDWPEELRNQVAVI